MTSKKEAGKSLAIVWFRRDLRLADNEALAAAAPTDAAIIPLYIDENEHTSTRRLGDASK